MQKVGLIVNPIAGMGGKVGLKGTDGEDVLDKAVALGAEPTSPERAAAAVRRLQTMKHRLLFVTGPAVMGEDVVRRCDFRAQVLKIPLQGRTTSWHTREAAIRLQEHGVALLLFAGGDGTARDIAAATGERLVALGIPTGVKMHSAVFAVNPSRAGDLAAAYLSGEVRRTRAAEVMDVDERVFRAGRVAARLYGYLTIPFDPGRVQGPKTASPDDEDDLQAAIAAEVVENMVANMTYMIGPGTTTFSIMKYLGLDGSLLGIDVVRNRRLEGRDVSEKDLLAVGRGTKSKIVVTPIGGQGYLFGRGNQPLSAEVIQLVGKGNLIIVATPRKLSSFRGRSLRVDTGDPETDRSLSGYYKIITGCGHLAIYRVAAE